MLQLISCKRFAACKSFYMRHGGAFVVHGSFYFFYGLFPHLFSKSIIPNCFPCKLINDHQYDDADDGETRSAWQTDMAILPVLP